jgi:glycosyltransferase involved in cell wall biosynthesis
VEFISIMPFFPKTPNTPLISVLIPTRKRTKPLIDSINSVLEMSSDRSWIEFVIKVDEDDAETIDIVNQLLATDLLVKLVVSPRGNGYSDMPRYVNEMCQVASGDWFFFFNDDAIITTPRWDEMIYYITSCGGGWPGITKYCLLLLKEKTNTSSYAFQIIRRGAWELLGHWSKSSLCDAWMYSVLAPLNMITKVPIVVDHQKIDDEDRSGIDKELAWSMRSLESIRGMHEDSSKILSACEKIRNRMIWHYEPGKTDWYWWRKEQGKSERATFVIREKETLPIQTRDGVQMVEGGNAALVFSEDGKLEVGNIKEMGGEWAWREA